jgi:hypothetical protein
LNIQYQTEPKKLVYFWDSDLELKQPIPDGAGSVQRISFPFVAVLDFKIENEQVNRMSGYWYDINNSLFNLAMKIGDLKGIEELKNAVSRGAITFKGSTEFTRWEKPKGVE